jgi:hypothetical protein
MREGNRNSRQIIGSDELDFIADRLCLLFRLDQYMRADRTPF